MTALFVDPSRLHRDAERPFAAVSKPEDPGGAEMDLSANFAAELHDIASNLMRREPPDCSIQSTILVHDAYLKIQQQLNLRSADRAELLAAAAKIMRRLLVDHARRRRRLKRGGKNSRKRLPDSVVDDANPFDVVELHDALEDLRQRCEVTADIVEKKFFGGMTHEEIAEVTGLSERTVGEKWRFAKAWLYRSMTPRDP